MTNKPDYPHARIEYGEHLEVAPGVFWLRMPLPFSLDHINLWLLEDEGAWTLIDTGFNTKQTCLYWNDYFSDLLESKPVKRIIVTHFHPDHVSLAGWLVNKWSASIYMTHSEWMQVQLSLVDSSIFDIRHRLDFYIANGMNEMNANSFRSALPDLSSIITPLPDSFTRILDSDKIFINGDEWRVITGGGHSPEHAALWCSNRNILISGDQILPRISTNVSLQSYEPNGDPLGLYLNSLSKFSEVQEDALILPSHDLPFFGVHKRIQALNEHHTERLQATYEACSSPTTGMEMIPAIFNRKLNEQQKTFALGEALAHANHLVFQEKLHKEICDHGIIRYNQS